MMAMPAPLFGGATSFDEVDRWVATQSIQKDVDALSDVFEALTRNIWANDMMDVGAKADAIARAARDLSRRLGAGPISDVETLDEEGDQAEPMEMMDMRESKEGPLARVRSLFTTKAAPTKTEGGVAYRASDYADVPDESSPSTWKLRLAEGRPGNITIAQVARAITAMQPGGFRGQTVDLGNRKSAVTAKIGAAIDKAKGEDIQKANLRDRLAKVKDFEDVEWGEYPGSFSAFKDASGTWRWTAIWSNHYQDRDGETFSADAHKDYEAYVDREKAYPELLGWHEPGARVGVADGVAYDDRGFMLAAGTFDPAMMDVAERLASMKGVGCSHGYFWRKSDLVDGVYRRYRTREISFLPVERAANPLTSFTATGQEDSMLNPQKKEWLTGVLGSDRVAALEGTVQLLADKAAAEGLSFKELFADGPTPPPAAVTSPARPPPSSPAGDTTEALKEVFAAALAPVAAQLNEIQATIKAHDEAITALRASDDQKIAAAMSPRVNPGMKAASQSDGNVIHGNSALAKAAKAAGSGDVANHLAYYKQVIDGERAPSLVISDPTPASV